MSATGEVSRLLLLQLEQVTKLFHSDILAELDYPHSGLSAMEGTVNWPNNVLDEEASRSIVSDTATDLDMINIYYSAQLFLRKHLNQIHTRIYSVDRES